MALALLASLILLLFPLSSFAFPPFVYLLNDAQTQLMNSGYLSMALTLQIASEPILCQSPTATVFAPLDAAFIHSGQPSLQQLLYHSSPFRFSIQNLKSLPFGSSLPTMLPNHSLIVTSWPSDALTINNVRINEKAIYDDERSLLLYGTDDFFSYSVQTSPKTAPVPSPTPAIPQSTQVAEDQCDSALDYYGRASDFLRSTGYSRMATFLEMQLARFADRTKLTIFAPTDASIDECAKDNFSKYSLIFRRHVVPNRLSCTDLVRVEEGRVLTTFSGGFVIEVTRSGDVIELNGVPIIFPDMYSTDWLVVHGLHQSLKLRPKQGLIGDFFSELDANSDPYYDEGYQLPH